MTASALHPTVHESVGEILAGGLVRTVFQPIVDLESREVVAHEALSRGPAGPLESPLALFGAARDAGRLADLDHACALSAFGSAIGASLVAPGAVLVNVEPEVLDTSRLDDLLAVVEQAPGPGLRVVLEVTERALAARPAELLDAMDRVRDLGWGVALDDVGADSASLAFMSLLRPDLIKLDLALVQNRPDQAAAEVMHAVNAYAERSGAQVLAEGIETEAHLVNARAFGATLGQGWMFGRPSDTPALIHPHRPLPSLAGDLTTRPTASVTSPFGALPPGLELAVAPKRLLIELSKQLEREAARLGATCVIASTFQDARHFTTSTARRYTDLARQTGFVCVLGRDLPIEPVPGVRGAELRDDDPILGEWDVVVLNPHFATALLARDLGDGGPEMERRFEFALTYRRDTVAAAARALLSRIVAPD